MRRWMWMCFVLLFLGSCGACKGPVTGDGTVETPNTPIDDP